MRDGKAEASDGLLDVAALVRMFEESEDATYDARIESERDRDYVDNKQLTSEELAELAKRGQPPQIDNRIKTKIDYLVGLEKQQRIDPKALPRTPVHEEEADGATQALRYVAETELFDNKRSGVWRNLLVEGAGGVSVSVEPSYREGEMDIKLRRIAWDRMFWDPHSSETDFSDANYLGVVVWMDYDDAVVMYPDAKEALDATLTTAPQDTYDDKPKFTQWADKKRKRVRICEIWIKRSDKWYFAEYTKGGILKAGPSPYVTDKGESDCGLFFQSAYVDRDNNRYGLVREMITLQDGINKRHSKALHLLNAKQVFATKGIVDDVEKSRREMHKPDGWVELNMAPGSMNENIRVESQVDLAVAQLNLLQEAKNSIDLKGPNATQMGDKAQGSSAASGRAILASQQGGMISLGDLLDNLRHLDRRVFRAIWNRIRQFWNGEKWLRITDDERNIRWVVMNADPMMMQQMQGDPRIAGMIQNVAELDCDIIIDEVPDNIASQEQFAQLVELKKFDMNNELPFRALVAASSIKDKSKMLEEMDKAKEPGEGQMIAQQLQIAGAEAKVAETQASAGLKDAQRQKTLIEAQLAPAEFEQEQAMKVAEFNQQASEADAGRQERFAMKDADLRDRSEDRKARQAQQSRAA